MAKRVRRAGRSDPLESDVEEAFCPGDFISDRGCWEFVSDLERTKGRIAKLLSTEPTRAVALYETLLAGCYEKAEELDDSSGTFGQFVGELFCAWIKARQAAGNDPLETAQTLLARMADDPYGFCYKLEEDAVKAFDRAGRAALEQEARRQFETRVDSEADTPEDRTGNFQRRRSVEILKAIYTA